MKYAYLAVICVVLTLTLTFDLSWSVAEAAEPDRANNNGTNENITVADNPGNKVDASEKANPNAAANKTCKPSPCKNGATCQEDSGMAAGYNCTCVQGWMGTNCSEADLCSPNPCNNSGECSQNGNMYTCNCTANYTGDMCQYPDLCAPNPCNNSGECSQNGTMYTCNCTANYTGDMCQYRDLCSPGPCQSGGVCSQVQAAYSCNCTIDYTGENCENMVDHCQGHACLNGANCTVVSGGYNCTCLAGYGGLRCEIDTDLCDPNPCNNSATCVQVGMTQSCTCAVGYTGAFCETEIDYCAEAPCMNGGNCTRVVGSFNCTCVLGYTGNECQTNIDDCQANNCTNGATCVDGVNDYSCTCVKGWAGEMCDIDVNECTDTSVGNDCDVNADCMNTLGSYTCTCKHGYSGNGIACAFVSQCKADSCNGNGFCSSDMDDFTCFCAKGWAGKNCSEDFDECANTTTNMCDATSAICSNTNGSYECSCKAKFRGDGKMCIEENLVAVPFDAGSLLRPGSRYGDRTIYVPGMFPYFGKVYGNIVVSTYGYITFGYDFDVTLRPVNSSYFPPGIPMIAPYWMDLDVGKNSTGGILIRQYDINSNRSDPAINDTFNMVTDYAKEYLGNWTEFQASFILVALWHRVTPYPMEMYEQKQNVTFQVLLATDSKRSFVMYNYDRDRMFLSPTSNNWTVVLGHSNGMGNEVHLPTADKLRPDLSSNVGFNGRYVYSLGDAVANNNHLACLLWYKSQDSDAIELAKEKAAHCPCTSIQAKLDMRYKKSPNQENCYVPRFVDSGMPWNLCCYHATSGLVIGPGGGHLVLSSDTAADYDTCCTDTDLCQYYYRKRPANNCHDYQPPDVAAGWGDPHITTFDGITYTFNGRGEFVLLKAEISNVSSATLQGRTDIGANKDGVTFNATLFTAFACKGTDMPHLEIRVEGTNFQIHVDGVSKGTSISFTSEKFANMHLMKTGDHEVMAQYRNGMGLKIGLSNRYLWIRVTVPVNFKSKTMGLFGYYNDNPNDEFTMRNGTALPPQPTEEEIYNSFGRLWAITKEESIFTYQHDAKAYEEFVFANHAPEFYGKMVKNLSSVDGLNATIATDTCGDNVACLTDYIATRDISVARWSLQQQTDNVQFAKQIGNTPPVLLDTPEKIQAKFDQTFTYTVRAQDPEGKKVTYGVVTSLADSEYSMDNETGLFTWSPMRNQTYRNSSLRLMFYAQDPAGSASILWPRLEFDECHHGLNVEMYKRTDEYPYSPNNVAIETCDCVPGYRGASCMDSYNPCDMNPCYPGAECRNGSGPEFPMNYACGPCPQGMVGQDGRKCYDVDECSRGVCDQVCINQRGTFKCLCMTGYVLGADGAKCMDKDECTLGVPHHNCTGAGRYCVNTLGSFQCRCKARYYDDGVACQPAGRRFGGQVTFEAVQMTSGVTSWDPEMATPGSDSFKYVAKSVETWSNDVFKDLKDFKTSKVYKIKKGSMEVLFDLFFGDGADVNGTVLNSTIQKVLEDNRCVAQGPDCKLGPMLGIDIGRSMAGDKDLCMDDKDNDCDKDSTQCSSQNGRFRCTCLTGYKQWLDYTDICQDIDECELRLADCDNKTSVCTNVAGSYDCSCRPGYTMVNSTCADVCITHPCMHGGICTATVNGYTCVCDGIWTGPHCDLENEEALRYRQIAIGVGAGIGALCLILLVILVVACCRQRRKKYMYSCSPAPKESKYTGGGTSTVDPWESSTVPVRTRVKTEYEMRENGSGDSLMDDSTHRYQTPGPPTSHPPGYSNNEPIPGAAQGVENPSYSAAGEEGNNAKKPSGGGGGDYF